MANPVPDSVIDHDAWRTLVSVDELGEGLSQWEVDFVESVMVQRLAGKRLSIKQRARLRQIQEDRCP